MYEAFFNLNGRPFLAAPHTTRYFPATVIENGRKTLLRCIDRGEGAGLIIGPAGTGKTLLCQMLADEFKESFGVALLSSGRLATRQALLQAILYELRRPYRGMDEGELRLNLLDYLDAMPEGQHGLLLLIDEAHALPLRLLEEVRMITNLARDGVPRVRVVLCGSPALEERFASPKLSSFSQRLAARVYLESLDSAETAEFVRAQITSVGGNARELFADDALPSIYRATDGIPRLINQVCDHALILASLGGHEQVTADAIDEAWSDLQQLPGPWSASPPTLSAADGVVEFGGLDDAQDDLPEAIPFPSAPPQRLAVGPEEQLRMIQDHLSRIDDDFQPAGSIGTEVELDFPEFGNPLAESFAEEEVVLERFVAEADIFADVPRVSSREGQRLGSTLEKFEPVRSPAASEVARVAPVAWPAFAETARSPSEAGMLIIEDDPKSPPLAPRPHKLEYGQLFAKLRRG